MKFTGFKQVTDLQILNFFYYKVFKLDNYEKFLFSWSHCLERIMKAQMQIKFILCGYKLECSFFLVLLQTINMQLYKNKVNIYKFPTILLF